MINGINRHLTFPNLCYIPPGEVHMVTNARPPNETILAIAVPLLAAAGLHPPTRPSMDAAAELLTLDRRLPAEAKSVTRRNLTGNKRVAAFHFYCGAGGLWYGTPTTRPCLPLHCICMAAQPGPPIKAKTLVIKAHQGSSRLIKPQSRQKPL